MKRIFCLFAILILASLQTRAADAAPNWTVYRDVRYGVSEQEKADLYLLNRGVNPVVVMIHGGGWQGGDKSSYAGYYAEMYARAGFHVVAINYRLAKYGDRSTQWNAQLQDVQLAIRWLRQYASALRIDPARIGAVGDSAGGHLALFLGSLATSAPNMTGGIDRAAFFPALSPKVSAVVDMFGPTDLTRPEMYTQLAPSALFGARPYPVVPNLYRNASPIFTLSTRTAPACVVHGTLDPVVPVSQSLSLISRLSQLGVSYKFIPFLGGHSFSGLSGTQRTAIDRAALLCISNILRPNPLNAL
ncbi:alpha/beta hydrolase [Methylocystis sp. WRRC1]|uniref:alpha/beta hydrolase n=1 Tax=unclassified Methylocystis TaxID=2625913 RepID=UPI0001F873A5|nr:MULTISPECIES: alpha/beta hydrolase [unclassified Methylocystis]MCC3246625.1 alpha/beta hydrolase [Methylocystis sp. WRRC1]